MEFFKSIWIQFRAKHFSENLEFMFSYRLSDYLRKIIEINRNDISSPRATESHSQHSDTQKRNSIDKIVVVSPVQFPLCASWNSIFCIFPISRLSLSFLPNIDLKSWSITNWKFVTTIRLIWFRFSSILFRHLGTY